MATKSNLIFAMGGEQIKMTFTILEGSRSKYLIHRDILRHQLSQRQGTVSTKTRSEVRGGGKKPWRQKGTGRARAGSSRSPLWKGGGVIFGPKPKTVNLKLNKKERNLALQTLFYNKVKSNCVIFAEANGNLEHNIPAKTKAFYKFSQSLKNPINSNEKVLVIVSEKGSPIKLATQNLKNVELISASNLNTLSLLKAKKIIITRAAVYALKEIYEARQ